MKQTLRVLPIGGVIGARVEGIDISKDLDEQSFQDIHKAFLDHHVLVFPDQRLTPARQIAFTSRFGAVQPHPLKTRRTPEGFPEVMILENRPGIPGARNDVWHLDVTCTEIPPAIGVLHALEIPGNGQGDTQFSNLHSAYGALSAGLQKFLHGLGGLHSAQGLASRFNNAHSDALPITNVPPPIRHPIVRTHPETGKRTLFISVLEVVSFEGMTAQESEPILNYLYSVATRAEHVYRHRWSVGDVVMWDNRCVMHYGVHDYDDKVPRLMHRTTAAGDRPV